jgi:sugar transferase (PEP-CTERM/EpsH1 system associated)
MHRGRTSLARTYWDLYRLFLRLKPSVVHSRNLSGLDALLPAACAGVGARVHGEHGRDMDDLDGTNPKYRRLKRLLRPLVTHYITVSVDLADYLKSAIGVPADRVCQIYNGVDTDLFCPAPIRPPAMLSRESPFVVGSVGRLQPVKDQVSLVKAFAAAVASAPAAMRNARLVIVGDGPSRAAIEQAVAETSLHSQVDLLGARNDVPELLRAMSLFVLPSLAEGISNTILEAMATGLPVIATRVGGNADLVHDGVTGMLADAGDWHSMGRHIAAYASDPSRLASHGRAARARAEQEFSLDTMVENYAALYDRLTGQATQAEARTTMRSAS